jgi:hypothetical protein
VSDFTKLDGIQIWREWSQFTEQIADSVKIIDSCDVYNYLQKFNTSLRSKRERMIMVYSVHNYMKEGSLNEHEIVSKVDSLISEDNEEESPESQGD